MKPLLRRRLKWALIILGVALAVFVVSFTAGKLLGPSAVISFRIVFLVLLTVFFVIIGTVLAFFLPGRYKEQLRGFIDSGAADRPAELAELERMDIKELEERLRISGDPGTRLLIVNVLGRKGGKEVIKFLSEYRLTESDPNVAEEIDRAIENIRRSSGYLI